MFDLVEDVDNGSIGVPGCPFAKNTRLGEFKN